MFGAAARGVVLFWLHSGAVSSTMVLAAGTKIIFVLSTSSIWGVNSNVIFVFPGRHCISAGGQLSHFGQNWVHFGAVSLTSIMVLAVVT